jgi:hypothetical protein
MSENGRGRILKVPCPSFLERQNLSDILRVSFIVGSRLKE